MALSIMTLNIMTLNIMTLNIMTLKYSDIQPKTLCLMIQLNSTPFNDSMTIHSRQYNTQHNDAQPNCMQHYIGTLHNGTEHKDTERHLAQ